MCEPGPHKGHLPSVLAAEHLRGRALAVFLEQPVPDPVLAPIRGQACWPFLVEYANSLLDPGRNLELGRLKRFLDVVSPHELGREGECHLVDQPEPGSVMYGVMNVV